MKITTMAAIAALALIGCASHTKSPVWGFNGEQTFPAGGNSKPLDEITPEQLRQFNELEQRNAEAQHQP